MSQFFFATFTAKKGWPIRLGTIAGQDAYTIILLAVIGLLLLLIFLCFPGVVAIISDYNKF